VQHTTTDLTSHGFSASQAARFKMADAVMQGKFGYVTTIYRKNPEIAWAEVRDVLARAKGEITFASSRSSGGGPAVEGFAAFVGDGVMFTVDHDAYWDEWAIEIAAVDSGTADHWTAAINLLVPDWADERQEDGDFVEVTFWAQNPMTKGVSASHRYLHIEHWDEIEGNYPAATREEFDALVGMTDGPEDGAGKLVLLHGPPGTGKTRGILSLIKSWSDWCEASVVTDSERFFGDPTYLNDLLFNVNGMADWLLIVVEDGDEFIDVDDRKGQGVSRLLNICDGMIGQGLNLMILLSTNTPMDRLNPALARPGRCLANIEFPAFSAGEALEWLTAALDGDSTGAAEALHSLIENPVEWSTVDDFTDQIVGDESDEPDTFTLAQLYAALRS